MKAKQAWDEYGGLLTWIGGIVGVVGSAVVFFGGLYLTAIIDARIDAHKPISVQTAETQLAVNTNAIQGHTQTINGLSTDIRSLDDDVRAMLIIASGQTQ